MIKYILYTILSIVGASIASATDFTQDANCVGAWGLEDETGEADLSSNNEDLTESSGDTISRSKTHKFGTYSKQFYASHAESLEHVDGGSTDINGADAKITICCWMYTYSDTSNQYILGKYDTTANQRQYNLYFNATKDVVSFSLSTTSGSGAAGETVVGQTDLATNTWYHIAATCNDVDMRIFIDGELDCASATDHTDGIFNGSAKFCLGNIYINGSLSNNGLSGLLDDVIVFDRALSKTEIQDIMNNGMQGSAAPASTELPVFMNLYRQRRSR